MKYEAENLMIIAFSFENKKPLTEVVSRLGSKYCLLVQSAFWSLTYEIADNSKIIVSWKINIRVLDFDIAGL